MEKIEIWYRPEDVGDGHRYEATCGEADAAGATPAEAFGNLAAILEKTPAADAVRAAKVVADGPRAGEPVPVSTPDEALKGELAASPVATGPATAPTAPTAEEADAKEDAGEPTPSGPTPIPPPVAHCPEGYVWDPDKGECVKRNPSPVPPPPPAGV